MLHNPSTLVHMEGVTAGSPWDVRSARADEMPQAVSTIVAAFIADRFARFVWSAA